MLQDDFVGKPFLAGMAGLEVLQRLSICGRWWLAIPLIAVPGVCFCTMSTHGMSRGHHEHTISGFLKVIIKPIVILI